MTADDVKVGQIVTVRDWYANESINGAEWSDSSYIFGAPSTPKKNRSYMGAVLRVEAVSLPYVALTKAFSREVVTLDLRECELTLVSPAFVAALRQKHRADSKKKKARGGMQYLTFAPWASDDEDDNVGDDA